MLETILIWSFMAAGVVFTLEKLLVFQYLRIRRFCSFCLSFWLSIIFFSINGYFGMFNVWYIVLQSFASASAAHIIYKTMTKRDEGNYHF